MSKRILFISESYLNNPSPNGRCVENIIKVLKKQNFFVSVLCLKNQFIKNDTKVDGVDVFRVDTHAEWKILFFRNVPKVLSVLLSKLIKTLKNVFIIVHPLNSPIVILKLYLKGKKIIKDQNINTIVAVYRDFETTMAGVLLKKKYPKIKLCIYTLDSISGGVCSNKIVSKRFHVNNCRRWEEFFLKSCDVFCTMNSHDFFYNSSLGKKYSNKIRILDIPNLIYNKTNNNEKKLQKNQINFIFTGMMTETNADCTFFLEVFKNIVKIKDSRFDIYGGISDNIMNKIRKTGLYEKNIFFHGKLDHQEVINKINTADILLNFGNEYSCGIPCKIFEYMCTGKIIVSFFKIDKDASLPYLTKYRNALLLREYNGKQNEYATQILDFYDSNYNLNVEYDEISRLFYKNKPEEFLKILDLI